MQTAIKKEMPGGVSQPDITKNQEQYSRSEDGCQEVEWTLWDLSLRARPLSEKRWSGSPNLHRYKVNVNNPEVKPIYKRYCYLVTGREGGIISDTQRFEFDRMVRHVLSLYDKTKEEKIQLLKWEIERIPSSPFWRVIPWVKGGKHLEHEYHLEREEIWKKAPVTRRSLSP